MPAYETSYGERVKGKQKSSELMVADRPRCWCWWHWRVGIEHNSLTLAHFARLDLRPRASRHNSPMEPDNGPVSAETLRQLCSPGGS